MKNPYAKSSAKRPRIEEQKLAETNQNGSHDLDSSFDGGVDWNEALKVLDQASQSYQERENKSVLNNGSNGGSVAVENRPVASRSACSSLKDNTGGAPRKPLISGLFPSQSSESISKRKFSKCIRESNRR